jgi:hypothetical protein
VEVHDPSDSPRLPSLAVANGRAVVAFLDDTNVVTVATIEGTGVTQAAPPVSGGRLSSFPPGVAASANGTIAVVYAQSDDADPGNSIVNYWTVGSPASIAAARRRWPNRTMCRARPSTCTGTTMSGSSTPHSRMLAASAETSPTSARGLSGLSSSSRGSSSSSVRPARGSASVADLRVG